jgi:flagellar hook-associated protein 3 FlgL
MRISTKSIYDNGVAQMNSLQAAQARTQQQLSTNRRMLTPSDDPVASARALEVTQAQSINAQMVTNRNNAKTLLGQEELVLKTTNELIADAKDLMVKAGNSALTDADRGTLAVELEQRLNDLIAQANFSDGAGGYLFSGFKTATQPYSPTATGAVFAGDDGQRQLQVGPSRFLAVGDTGTAVFDSNLTGNGTFTTRAAVANTGQGTITGGSVTDKSLLTGHDYQINFTSATTYDVIDATSGPVLTGQPYASGAAIAFDGMRFDIKGTPAAGDAFTAEPSTKESLFTTLKTLLGVLRTPVVGPTNQAELTNALTATQDTLDTAFDNVLSVRAEVGARMKELDYLDSSGSDLDIQYAGTLKDLQDLDFIAATSLFAQQKNNLQAALQSFTMMSGLSLFNYIS